MGADPRALVTTVLGRLPRGTGFQAAAGWFALLGSAAGESGAILDEKVAQILSDRGWRTDGNSLITEAQAHRGARATLQPLKIDGWRIQRPRPRTARHVTRATLFGLTTPTWRHWPPTTLTFRTSR
ncbi:MAG: hypothetical protein WCF36_18170 [Candidatus Nanopelagicales bacterium]